MRDDRIEYETMTMRRSSSPICDKRGLCSMFRPIELSNSVASTPIGQPVSGQAMGNRFSEHSRGADDEHGLGHGLLRFGAPTLPSGG